MLGPPHSLSLSLFTAFVMHLSSFPLHFFTIEIQHARTRVNGVLEQEQCSMGKGGLNFAHSAAGRQQVRQVAVVLS